jgi:hypothetical protein
MQQAFITSTGKVYLENEILFIRKLKPSLTFSQVATVAFPVFIILRFIMYVFENNTLERNVGLVVLGFLSLFYGMELGYKLFKAVWTRSFSNRIALQQIQSFRTEDDANGLEVHLFLRLRSGRERKITFRKLEKQYEELILILSPYLPLSAVTT